MTSYCPKCKKLFYTQYGSSQIKEYKKKKYIGLGGRIEKMQQCPYCSSKKMPLVEDLWRK